jgi:hypothetical protein
MATVLIAKTDPRTGDYVSANRRGASRSVRSVAFLQ